MTKKEKMKKWFKENKEKLIVGGLALAGAYATYVILRKPAVDVCDNDSNSVSHDTLRSFILGSGTIDSDKALESIKRMDIDETFERGCFYQDWGYDSLDEKCINFCNDKDHEYHLTLIAERRKKK